MLQTKRGSMEEAVELHEKVERLEEGGGELITEDEVDWLLKSDLVNGDGKIDLAAFMGDKGNVEDDGNTANILCKGNEHEVAGPIPLPIDVIAK